MKKYFLLLSLLAQTTLDFAQCSVTKDKLEDGAVYFAPRKEKIYGNDDLEYRILVSYIRLIVIQSPTNKELLQFAMLVDVGRSGSKKMVVPRKILIQFTDNSTLNLSAESLQDPTLEHTVYLEHSTFRQHEDSFISLQNKSIAKITIFDNRLNTELVCQPYADILKEQATVL